jgi:hypothetical protein
MKPTDGLVRIAAAGGGLDLRNVSKSTDNLVRITAAGNECVTIYFD